MKRSCASRMSLRRRRRSAVRAGLMTVRWLGRPKTFLAELDVLATTLTGEHDSSTYGITN